MRSRFPNIPLAGVTAAITMIVSAGRSEEISPSRRRLAWGLIGLVLVIHGGLNVPHAEAQTPLVVDSGTTVINSAQSYSNTRVATNAIDTATLSVTT